MRGRQAITPVRDSVASQFAPLIGQYCWGVSFEPRLNLSMSFGRPAITVREPSTVASRLPQVRRQFSRRVVTIRGEWWLWLNAPWRLKLPIGLGPGTTSEGHHSRLRAALRALDGQALTSVEVNAATGRTRLFFDLGAELDVHVRQAPKRAQRLWTMAEHASGRHLSVRSDGTVWRGRGTSMPDAMQWRPIGSQ